MLKEYIKKQTMAREYYEKYLRMDAYYRYVFGSRAALFTLAHREVRN